MRTKYSGCYTCDKVKIRDKHKNPDMFVDRCKILKSVLSQIWIGENGECTYPVGARCLFYKPERKSS